MKPNTYGAAGVDVARSDRFVDFIKSFNSPAVSKTIGGFSGAFEVDPLRYRHPVFMTTTDGVGTKILIAREMGTFDTIGIDLVAMCVNDLIVCGADPVSFLDYIACARIDEGVLREVVRGVVAGCEQEGCTLAGGETAELPGMYDEGEFDLAGFAVGIADKDRVLPRREEIREGDLIMALPSVGIHSNGLTLARKVVPNSERALRRELLKPTKIFVPELKPLLETGYVLAAAHVTGGGLLDNFRRVVPDGLLPQFDYRWPVPEIFEAIQRLGRVETEEMHRVFNMGIGIAFVVRADKREAIEAVATKANFETIVIGELIRG